MEPFKILFEQIREIARVWWTASTPLNIRHSRDEVITSIKHALDEANIEIPFPYRTLI